MEWRELIRHRDSVLQIAKLENQVMVFHVVRNIFPFTLIVIITAATKFSQRECGECQHARHSLRLTFMLRLQQ